jgi:membrane protein implicated in regulation of membrane protease activity
MPHPSFADDKKKWTVAILVRYTALQLLGLIVLVGILLLVEPWLNLPAWCLWLIIGLWILKDAALFPLTWRAYDWDRTGNDPSLEGHYGIVHERLDPAGYVKIRGELWRAEIAKGDSPVEVGDQVRVLNLRGLTLLVKKNDLAQTNQGNAEDH